MKTVYFDFIVIHVFIMVMFIFITNIVVYH